MGAAVLAAARVVLAAHQQPPKVPSETRSLDAQTHSGENIGNTPRASAAREQTAGEELWDSGSERALGSALGFG